MLWCDKTCIVLGMPEKENISLEWLERFVFFLSRDV